MDDFHLSSSLQQVGCSPRGLDLGTRWLPTQMAHHDGTDANRSVFGERLHKDLLPSPSACPMDAILDEASGSHADRLSAVTARALCPWGPHRTGGMPSVLTATVRPRPFAAIWSRKVQA
jgi:hypothetical protein